MARLEASTRSRASRTGEQARRRWDRAVLLGAAAALSPALLASRRSGLLPAHRQDYALKEIDLHGMTRKVRLRARRQAKNCCRRTRAAAAGAQEQEECIKETQILYSLDCEYIIK